MDRPLCIKDKKKDNDDENKLELNEQLNTDNVDIKNTIGETNINNTNQENNEEENENVKEVEELTQEEEILKIDLDNIKLVNLNKIREKMK